MTTKKQIAYKVTLHEAHKASGLPVRQVHKATEVGEITITKYSRRPVYVTQIGAAIAILCDFYGVQFHDVVSVEEVGGNGIHS